MAGEAVLICGADIVTLPWWPTSLEWTALTGSWTEQPRPGRAPLLLKEANQLPELNVGCILATKSTTYVGDGGTVQPTISALRRIAASDTPAQLMLATRDTGRWRVIDLQYSELDHDAAGNVTKAELSMTLKRAQDAAAAIGPIPPKKKKARR